MPYLDDGDGTICPANAHAAFDHPLTAEIHLVQLLVDDYTSGELIQRIATRCHGVLSYETATEHADT
ncbi:hypothetical protein [Rhodococcus rhodochrous]|uniref:hypothetical protein n=1 Tax=Rhodococcus rhodochrous TaxID=1829 RepID=UPI0011AE32A8|nr:hypothetical protein [Rhodococcus rhodochrous]